MPQTVKSKLLRADGTTADIVANVQSPVKPTQADRDKDTQRQLDAAIAKRVKANGGKVPAEPKTEK